MNIWCWRRRRERWKMWGVGGGDRGNVTRTAGAERLLPEARKLDQEFVLGKGS